MKSLDVSANGSFPRPSRFEVGPFDRVRRSNASGLASGSGSTSIHLRLDGGRHQLLNALRHLWPFVAPYRGRQTPKASTRSDQPIVLVRIFIYADELTGSKSYTFIIISVFCSDNVDRCRPLDCLGVPDIALVRMSLCVAMPKTDLLDEMSRRSGRDYIKMLKADG